METVVSGLDEASCREIVGATLWAQESIRWQSPDKLLESLAAETEVPAGRRIIWFYRSPAKLAVQAPADNARELQISLEQWLAWNRAVLNLRRRLGQTLLVVNADNVSYGDLRAELGCQDPLTSPDAADGKASLAIEDAGRGRDVVIGHLFEWIAPRYSEILDALEAASWLPKSEPGFRDTVTPNENQLVDFLEMLRNGSKLPTLQAQLKQNESVHEELARDLAETKAEKQNLLLQLHQVQEELEQYFLKTVALEKVLAAAKESSAEELEQYHEKYAAQTSIIADQKDSTDELRSQNQTLQLHLDQMQKKLEDDSAQVVNAVRQRKIGQWPRLISGRIRLTRERAKAHKAMQAELNTIRKSKWFNGEWYLDTYPDAHQSGMDPVEHYFEFGWKEARNPSEGFDTSYYLKSNPDVASSGLNPLLHFIEYGSKEGRLPRRA